MGTWCEAIRQHLWHSTSSTRTHTHRALVTATDSVLTDNAHPHHTRARAHVHCIKVYTDKQHTRSIWCLQLTHSETSNHTVRPRLVQQQHERACESVKLSYHIQFLNVLGAGSRGWVVAVGRSATPFPSSRNLLLWASV